MAKNSTSKNPSFYEVVFKGSKKKARGLLSGLQLGWGGDATIFFNYDEGIFHEGVGEKVAELIHLKPIDCHVVVDADTCARLKKLKKSINSHLELEILAFRHIRSATLRFDYEAFAPKYLDEIKALLDALPRGLKLIDCEEKVSSDPSAKGAEGYSPVHHFEAKGEGTIKGRVDLLIEARRALDRHPLISVDEIRLSMA